MLDPSVCVYMFMCLCVCLCVSCLFLIYPVSVVGLNKLNMALIPLDEWKQHKVYSFF